jgi:hypothetical protein
MVEMDEKQNKNNYYIDYTLQRQSTLIRYHIYPITFYIILATKHGRVGDKLFLTF